MPCATCTQISSGSTIKGLEVRSPDSEREHGTAAAARRGAPAATRRKEAPSGGADDGLQLRDVGTAVPAYGQVHPEDEPARGRESAVQVLRRKLGDFAAVEHHGFSRRSTPRRRVGSSTDPCEVRLAG